MQRNVELSCVGSSEPTAATGCKTPVRLLAIQLHPMVLQRIEVAVVANHKGNRRTGRVGRLKVWHTPPVPSTAPDSTPTPQYHDNSTPPLHTIAAG